MTMPDLADWSYEGPSGDLGTVRFLIGDTDRTVRLLSDTEIQYLLTTWLPRQDSVIYVAAVAAEQIAAKFAGVVSINADGVNVGLSDLTERFTQLAARLRALHREGQVGGEVDIANLLISWSQDPSIAPLRFGVGHMDNPEAGQEDYGGLRAPLIDWGVNSG